MLPSPLERWKIYKEQENATKYGDKVSVQDAVERFGLTKRESDILELLISGYSNKEICGDRIITSI